MIGGDVSIIRGDSKTRTHSYYANLYVNAISLMKSVSHPISNRENLTMLVTVVPASTKSGAATVRSLLTKPVQVRGIYRDLSKIPAAFSAKSNFSAVEGNASDEGTLDLTGSDAVLAIIPPVFDGRDLIEHAEKISSNIKSAIELAGNVKILVLLSSGGAEFSKGVVRIFRPRIL